ncbi:MAG: helix-turn-helix domain-containing protein [Treponema sp.]|jgi:transcriptional regulator with XRE-family HTH domain|nr:helix-turn-helix domain-containing protein [Treponema sp.]
MALQNVFITNMKKYRKQAQLTHEKLAELCNSDPRYISQIETGRRFPSITFIDRIATALNIAPYFLFYEEIVPDGLNVAETRKRKLSRALVERVSREIDTVIDDLY